MRKKHRLQLSQDLILTAILTALFGYHLWEEAIHEWLGLGFLALICSHTGLNLWWFKALLNGRKQGIQAVRIGVNFAIFALFFTACFTGILLSKHLFDGFFFHSTAEEIRKLHMFSTHWLQMLVGVHLGLHWQAIGSMLTNGLRLNLDEQHAKMAVKRLLPIMWSIISLYGGYVFMQRDLLPYLLNQVNFAFFNFGESKIRFYFDFFAILITVAYATRMTLWIHSHLNYSIRNKK